MSLMKAIQVNSPGAGFELVHKQIPKPKENEVLIKVEACGICHGDAVVKEGFSPVSNIPEFRGMKLLE